MEREGGAERPLVHSPHGLSGWSRKPRIRNFILASHMGAGCRGLKHILLFLQATRRKLDWKVEHQGHDSAPIQDVGNADGFWFCPTPAPAISFKHSYLPCKAARSVKANLSCSCILYSHRTGQSHWNTCQCVWRILLERITLTESTLIVWCYARRFKSLLFVVESIILSVAQTVKSTFIGVFPLRSNNKWEGWVMWMPCALLHN